MEHEYVDDADGGVLTAPATTTMTATVTAEIDKQIATAKAYPRSVKRFISRATELVTLNSDIAAACIYSLPRDGKQITGPSVRFAEMIASAFGNLRCGARVVDEGDTMITAQGVCHDLESNLVITFEVQRRITKKNGQRFGDDMIVVAGNAANSIALRNAILRTIPKALWAGVYDAARKTAVGDAKTLASRRDAMVSRFGQLGITKEKVLAQLGKPGVEDITLDDLERMIGVFTAIKDGKAIEEFFPAPSEAKIKADAALSDPPKQAKADTPPPSAEPVDWYARIAKAENDAHLVVILDDARNAGLEQSLFDDIEIAIDDKRNQIKDAGKKPGKR